MSAKTRDMTVGSPVKLALSFALPLMLGNICQQLYTITDASIVGQFAGIDALSALGSADWMVWMVFGVIGSIAHGFGIPIAQAFGAGDHKRVRNLSYNALLISLAIAIAYTVVGLIAIQPLLTLLGTIEKFKTPAATYLYIMVSGTIITTAYNLAASILRALGNSKAPLIAMIISSVTNIALDLLFVWYFDWNVAGAAAATVISQVAAFAVCAIQISKIPLLKPERGELKRDNVSIKLLIKLSIPMALQSAMIGLGGMALQRVINGLGAEYVAGFTATNKLYGLMEVAAVAFGMAVVTYVGQNLGAGNIKRIRVGMNRFVPLGAIVSLVMTGILFAFGNSFLKLFIEKGAPEEATAVALRYLKTMAGSLSILYLLYIYRSALLGIGDTLIPMISGFAECAARVGIAVLLISIVGKSGIYWAETAAWSAAMIILMISWYIKQSKLKPEQIKNVDGGIAK